MEIAHVCDTGTKLDSSHPAKPLMGRHDSRLLPGTLHSELSSTEGGLVRRQLRNRIVTNVPFLPSNPLALCHRTAIHPPRWHLSTPNSSSAIFKFNLREISIVIFYNWGLIDGHRNPAPYTQSPVLEASILYLKGLYTSEGILQSWGVLNS